MQKPLGLFVVFMMSLSLFNSAAQAQDPSLGDYTLFRQAISGPYVRDTRIGSIRPNEEKWSAPIYRIGPTENHPLVEVTNGWRTQYWPIPTTAIPAAGADGHMAVVYAQDNIVYEVWAGNWASSSKLRTGSFLSFPLNGGGVTTTLPSRTTASGFAVTAGMITREDFTDPATGNLNTNMTIDHALTMALNFDVVAQHYYVNPAVWGEELGRSGVEGIPLGRRYALPSSVDVDSLGVHPFTRELLRALRDYGVYINDTNATPAMPTGQYIGTVRVEPGLTQALYGLDNDTFRLTVGTEIETVLATYGLFNVNPNEELRWSGNPPDYPAPPDANPSQSMEDFGDFSAFIPDDSAPITPTNTIPNGNAERVEVDDDGNIHTTITSDDGTVVVVSVQPSGTVITTITHPDGTVTITETPPLKDLDDSSTPSILAEVPNALRGLVFGRVIAENSNFYRSVGEVGIQSVLDLGVIHAVDIFSPSGESAAGMRICMKGYGAMHFMDATGVPRTAAPLATTYRAGYTCTVLPGLGTLAMTGTTTP